MAAGQAVIHGSNHGAWFYVSLTAAKNLLSLRIYSTYTFTYTYLSIFLTLPEKKPDNKKA